MILRTIRKHYDLIPMVTAVSFGCIMGTAFMFYAAITKPDVRWNKSSELPPEERMTPTEKRKLYTVNEGCYKPIDEVEKLKAEIGPAKY